MALFKRDFSKPGPGVPKNAPRKKGFPRLFEILGRDFGNLVKLNLIYLLFVLVPVVCLVFTYISYLAGVGLFMLLAAVLGIAACIPLGPATTGMYYCVSKMLWDEPGFIWHDFKKAFKENFRLTVGPGIAYGVLTGSQVLAFLLYNHMEVDMGIPMMALFFFSVLFVAMAAPYFFVQAPYLNSSVSELLRNSFMLAIGFAPKSLLAAVLGTGLLVAQVLAFPLTLPIILFFGFTMPCLFSLMWVWPVVDKQFEIEKTLRKRAEERALAESGAAPVLEAVPAGTEDRVPDDDEDDKDETDEES